MTYQLVEGAGGVRLAVTTWGPRAGTPVVLVHGYPDTSAIWHPLAERLAAGGLYVVAYDVRGAGASTAPTTTAEYAMPYLMEDLGRVIDATCDGRKVHLVGHDWGSIQCWEPVTEPAFAAARLASFTSMSGPCLDHVGVLLRERPSLVQLIKSWYIYAFHVPGAPLAWRLVGPRWAKLVERVEGVAASAGDRTRDGARGIGLYRANIFQHVLRPRARGTLLPVQLIVLGRDHFVDPALFADIERWAPNVVRRDVVAGHWDVFADPDLLARWMFGWIAGERRAPRSLAIVTGAGSGIGRATAIELAARGSTVICADVDGASATVTAELAGLVGGPAHARVVDVSDAAAMARFAADVRRDFGAPDIVVNNAGVAVAGGFLATSEREWDRVMSINVDGVARGCRLFAQQMVEARKAGHLVNVASAAAFAPSRTLPAYATSKAAVVMLSECLRAELAPRGIGVSAVCPGFVDTPITQATRFVASDAATEAKQRARAAALYRRRGLTAERVARAICDAIDRDLPLATIGVEARAVRLLARFAPALSRQLARLDLA